MTGRRTPSNDVRTLVDGLPEPVRPLLAAVHGMGATYAASAVARLPYGTTAHLLAVGALAPHRLDGYAPQITRLGKALIAHLAATQSHTVTTPSRQDVTDAYADFKAVTGRGSGLPAELVLSPATTRVRELRALSDRLIGDVLSQDEGVVEVKDPARPPASASLLLEDADGKLRVSALAALAPFDLVSDTGESLREQPALLPLGPQDDLRRLAEHLHAVDRE